MSGEMNLIVFTGCLDLILGHTKTHAGIVNSWKDTSAGQRAWDSIGGLHPRQQ